MYQKRLLRSARLEFRHHEQYGSGCHENSSERGIRHLVVHRSISGPLYSRGAVAYLELLGIAQTCRFQEKSFLKFLLSGEVDVDVFQSGKQLTISRQTTSIARSRPLDEPEHP